jgi:hypothetical protein
VKNNNGKLLPKFTRQKVEQSQEESVYTSVLPHNDIDMVEQLMCKCFRLYMSQAEILSALRIYASIDPLFTTYGKNY